MVDFNTAKEAVAEETMRVFRQVGASEAEAKRWGDLINSSNSPKEMKANIGQLGTLLDSRVAAIGRQYERGIGRDNPAQVDPANRATLDRLKARGATPNPREVTLPNGKVMGFPTPAAAEAYRKSVGL